jgi:hypothetical protein
MRTKKAQFGGLQAIIITLVVIGVILGIGFLVLEEFKGNLDDYGATVSVPENIAPTDTGVYVTKNSTTAAINCYNAFAVTQIKNRTGNIIISSGNYTYNANSGLVKNISFYVFSLGNLWNITYTYKYGKDSCGGIVDTVDATKKIPTWLAIIVILLIVGILLAIVFSVLPSSGGGGGFSFKGSGGGGGGTIAEI